MKRIIVIDNLDLVCQLSQFDLRFSIEKAAGLMPLSLLNPKEKAVPPGFLAESRDIGPLVNSSARAGDIMRGYTLRNVIGCGEDDYPVVRPGDTMVIDPHQVVWAEFGLSAVDHSSQVVVIKVMAPADYHGYCRLAIRNRTITSSHPWFLFPGDASLIDAIVALCITAVTSVLSAPAENYEVRYIPREISSLIAAAAPSSRSELRATECSVSAVAISGSKEPSQAEWVAFSIARPGEEVEPIAAEDIEPSVEELVRLDILEEEMPF